MKLGLTFSMSILLIFVIGCTCVPLVPCGTFTFTGTTYDTTTLNGIDMNVAYDFNPDTCGSDCSCNLVCYIQIVRTLDFENGTYLYPSTEKSNRATTDGWYIDRVAGRVWGYYGRNDNGTFAYYLVTGTDQTDAILNDSPRRGESEPWLAIWWQAVSVPVCIDDDSDCLNNLLGYYFWSWFVDSTGTVTGILDTIAWEPLEIAVDDSVAEWNNQAPGLGKNTFPTFTSLP